jgi:hypothetical protein
MYWNPYVQYCNGWLSQKLMQVDVPVCTDYCCPEACVPAALDVVSQFMTSQVHATVTFVYICRIWVLAHVDFRVCQMQTVMRMKWRFFKGLWMRSEPVWVRKTSRCFRIVWRSTCNTSSWGLVSVALSIHSWFSMHEVRLWLSVQLYISSMPSCACVCVRVCVCVCVRCQASVQVVGHRGCREGLGPSIIMLV